MMSKEKNLTYLGKTDKPAINGREHEVFEYRTESSYSLYPDYHCDIYGPAADRLFEFEKLGMEPDEIRVLVESTSSSHLMKLEKELTALESTKVKFMSQNRRLIRNNADLEEKVKNLSHEIDNLVAENKALIAACKENDELRALNQRLYDKIADLGHEMDRLISDNKNLKSTNETLRHAADNTFDFGGIVHSGNHDYIQKYIDELVLANNKLKELSGIRKALEENNRITKEYINNKPRLFIDEHEKIIPLAMNNQTAEYTLKELNFDERINIEDVLNRADVDWYDDPELRIRRVVSRNKEAPLTKEEQEAITRMWRVQGYRGEVIFGVPYEKEEE